MLCLAAEWAPEILGAQAEWRTWLLREPPGQMAAEGDVGHHALAAARGLSSRSRSAWCPGRCPGRCAARPPL